MQDKELSKKIFSGMKWKAFERLFLQIINAVTPMVLARLLLPEDFGIVSILGVFISIGNTFVNNGLCDSIIQKKDSDIIDCSTVFYTQLIIAVICYFLLYVSAPLISQMYNNKELTPMLRVMSLSLIIGSFRSMQTTIMKKNMNFYKSFWVQSISTISYGVVGIYAAYAGMGCWSLVYASIAKSVISTICANIVVRWRPSINFSFERLKSLFSYSYKLTVGWLIGTLHQDVYTLVIGKMFSNATLGYYNRAGSFPQIITKTVTEVVDGVMFPALSRIQEDKKELKSVTRGLLSFNSYVLFPIFMGLAAAGDNIVSLILTEKWLPSVPMMRIMCMTFALNSINNSNMQVFNSMGRSDLFMKFEIVKRSLSIVLLFAVSFISIYAVIVVLLFMAILSNCMNAYQNKKLLNYKYFEFLYDIFPNIIISLIMAVCVFFVGKLFAMRIVSLAVQILAGVLIYILLSAVTKNDSFTKLIHMIKEKIRG